jgi:hypothetical protein
MAAEVSVPVDPGSRSGWRTSTVVWVLVGSLVAAAALVVVAGLVVVHVITSPCKAYPTSRVALPPVTASPQQVTEAFVAALNAGDYDTTTALMYPRAKAELWDQTDFIFGPSYFGHICEIANFQITNVKSPGVGGGGTPGLTRYHPVETTDVIANFDMVTKGESPVFDGVFGPPEGRFDLTGGGAIRLGRDKPTDRWQILQLDEDPA